MTPANDKVPARDHSPVVDWAEHSSKTIFSHPFFTLRRSAQHATNGKEGEFILLDCPDWVNVVALAEEPGGEAELILVRQYRFGTRSQCLEWPGGVVDPGEDHRAAAERELLEETGCRAATWTHLGSICPNGAFLTNRIHAWLARGLTRVADLALDHTEHLTVHRVPLLELEAGLHREFMENGMVIYAWHWFQEWRKASNSVPPL